MKKILFSCFICVSSVSFAFSQEIEDNLASGHFLKRIENNLTESAANYNMKSKSDLEKLFFRDFNAPLEFCYEPSSEINPCEPSCLRIIRDSLDSSYILEVKHISNYREATEKALKEAKKEQQRQQIDIPIRILDSLPKDVLNQIWEYNGNVSNINVFNAMYLKELPKHFKVEKKSIPISNQFAEKLYKMMVSFIGNFKAQGIPPSSVDGYSVSFRTVVADEVWSLRIHMPRGNANRMADFFMKIIKDANEDKLEESMLSNFNGF